MRSRAGIAIAIWMVATPASAADYYTGKTVDFLVGGDVGGGYDIYARVLSRHLPRFIPGNPTIVVKNQPGAGSGRAASFIYGVAPKDGSVIGAVFPAASLGRLLTAGRSRFSNRTRSSISAAATTPRASATRMRAWRSR